MNIFNIIKKDPFEWAYKGEQFLYLKKYKKALSMYNKAISLAEKQIEFKNIDLYYSSRAEIEKQLGLYNEALEDINNAIKIQPEVYLYYFERSEIKEKIGNNKGAQEDLDKIFSILDKNNSSHFFKIYLAKNKIKEGNYLAAEGLLKGTDDDIRYNNETVLHIKKEIYEKTKNYDELFITLDRLIELFPHRESYVIAKIIALVQVKKPDEALELIEKAIKRDPDNKKLELLKMNATLLKEKGLN